jgi:hypothetical protein
MASDLRFQHVPVSMGDGAALVAAMVLLHALEDAARGLGYRIARLDTGPRQPHAQGLYEAEGYRTVPNFNGNPVATPFGEKLLAPAGD